MATSVMKKFLKNRRAFQVLLVGSNVVPLITGTLVAILGVGVFVPTDQAGPEFAAQVRVYAIWFTAMFFLCLWVARNIEIGGPVLTIAASLMALAGVSRFYTMMTLDAFPVSTVIGGVVEIAVCLFIPWHRYLLRQGEA